LAVEPEIVTSPRPASLQEFSICAVRFIFDLIMEGKFMGLYDETSL
jgi:hypothetical protein